MPPPHAVGRGPDRLLTHTDVFALSGAGAFTTSFPEAITVAFGVDLRTDGVSEGNKEEGALLRGSGEAAPAEIGER